MAEGVHLDDTIDRGMSYSSDAWERERERESSVRTTTSKIDDYL